MSASLSLGSHPIMNFGAGHMERHRYGTSGINYGPDGRLITGDGTFPRRHRSMQSRRSAGSYDLDYRSYDPYREQGRRDKTSYDWDRTSPHDRTTPYDRPPSFRRASPSPYRRRSPSPPPRRRDSYEDRDRYAADYVREQKYEKSRLPRQPDSYGRRGRALAPFHHGNGGGGLGNQDWHDSPTGYKHYDTAGLIERPANKYDSWGGGGRDGETRWRIRTKEKAIGWYFVIEGVVILLVAIANTLLCVDHHFYCGFWIAFLLLELGIFGVLHKGNYESKWRNWVYIVLGVMSSIAAISGIAMILYAFAPTVRGLVFQSSAHIQSQVKYQDQLLINISHGYTPEVRVWTCLALDCCLLAFITAGFGALSAAAIVADNFYNRHLKVFKRHEPFCTPVFFNAYGQLYVAQAVAVLGAVVVFASQAPEFYRTSFRNNMPYSIVTESLQYMNNDNLFFILIPATGVIIGISGWFSAIGCKRPDKLSWNIIGVGLQIFTIVLTLVGVVFLIIGLVSSITSLSTINTSTLQGVQERRDFIGSACVYAVCTAAMFVGAFYSIGVIVRQVTNIKQYSGGKSWEDSYSDPDSGLKRHHFDRLDPYSKNPYSGGNYNYGYERPRY